jgi:adenylosuccinate synthase
MKLKEKHLEIIRFHKFNIEDQLIEGIPFNDYEEQWLKAIEMLAGLHKVDSEYFVNEQMEQGKSVLAEGAQGTLLDVDFGSYPFVTSSNTMIGGVTSGLGVPPKRIGKVMGIFKAYCTRVGSGPFPSEQENEDGDMMRQMGHEFGSTTGRPRRCGWLDLVALKYSIMISGIDSLLMMKTDVLDEFDTLKIGHSYTVDGIEQSTVPFDFQSGDLQVNYKEFPGWKTSLEGIESAEEVPGQLMNYIRFIEEYTGIPVEAFSYGPDRSQTFFF